MAHAPRKRANPHDREFESPISSDASSAVVHRRVDTEELRQSGNCGELIQLTAVAPMAGGESSRTPRRAPAQRRTSTSYRRGRPHDRVLHPGRVERRPPALLVVPRELEIVALARHAHSDPPNARPRKPGESECCSQELAALVEHALLDELICPDQHRLRDREAERLGGLEVDDQLELRGLLHWKIRRLCAPEDSVHICGGASM
jgi:hypothetical protein